jgi:hypothetical protein
MTGIYVHNNEARSRNLCYREKSKKCTYFERVFVALVIQHKKRIRHIVIYGLYDSATLLLNIKYVFCFSGQPSSEILLTLRRTQWNIIKVQKFSGKVPVFLFRFSWNFNFLDIFSKSIHASNFMKIHPVEAEFFNAKGQLDVRRDMTKLIVAFRKFSERDYNFSKIISQASKLPLRKHRIPYQNEYKSTWVI